MRSYTVTVVEQIRYEITVEANEAYVARADALLEARTFQDQVNPGGDLRLHLY